MINVNKVKPGQVVWELFDDGYWAIKAPKWIVFKTRIRGVAKFDWGRRKEVRLYFGEVGVYDYLFDDSLDNFFLTEKEAKEECEKRNGQARSKDKG